MATDRVFRNVYLMLWLLTRCSEMCILSYGYWQGVPKCVSYVMATDRVFRNVCLMLWLLTGCLEMCLRLWLLTGCSEMCILCYGRQRADILQNSQNLVGEISSYTLRPPQLATSQFVQKRTSDFYSRYTSHWLQWSVVNWHHDYRYCRRHSNIFSPVVEPLPGNWTQQSVCKQWRRNEHACPSLESNIWHSANNSTKLT
jgi:hypothetical protein